MFRNHKSASLFMLLLLGLCLSLPALLYANGPDSIILEHSEEWYTTQNTYIYDVAADDIDQDGTTEIVTVGRYHTGNTYPLWNNEEERYGQIKIWNWNGTTLETEYTKNWIAECPWPACTYNTTWRGIERVAISDVDDDGTKEIVTIGWKWEPVPGWYYKAELAIWNWNGTELELERVELWYIIPTTIGHDVLIDDVDDDGTNEILTLSRWWKAPVGNEAQLRIWNWNGTNLTLERSEEWEEAAEQVYHVALSSGDVDQDGDVEVITGGIRRPDYLTSDGFKSQVRIWNWNGTNLTLEHNEEWGEYTSANRSLVNSVFVKDLNNDSVPEIITSGYAHTPAQAQVRIWNWNGTSFTLKHSEEWNYTNGAIANHIYAADVNADGITELISVGHMNNDTYWQGQLRTWQWNGTNLKLMHDQTWGTVEIRGISVFASDVDGDYLEEMLTVGLFDDGERWNGQLRIWSLPDLTPPVADAGPDQEVNEDTIVTFNGSSSWDYTQIASYVWTFTDITPKTLTGVMPTYNFTNPGIYIVTLNVTDIGGNWDTDDVAITVLDITRPTIGTPSQEPDPTAVEPFQNVNVTVEVTDEGVGVSEVILSYSTDEGETWTNATMDNTEGDTYLGEIPGFEADTHVQYKIIAYDDANNSAVEDHDEEYYVYTVIPEFPSAITLLLLMLSTLITAALARKTRRRAAATI